MDWKYGLEILGSIFCVVFGFFLIYHFCTFIGGGTITWHEPNMAILVTEIILSGIIIAIGLERLFDDIL